MKPLIIYHDNCADGFGAAWAAYKKFGADGAEYFPMNYNDPRVKLEPVAFTDPELTFPALVDGRDIYILDFSFPKDVMMALVAAANTVVWRDHHKTAFEQFAVDPNYLFIEQQDDDFDVILDPNKSGCVLAWEHFHPDVAAPDLLLYIQDRDLWRWRLHNTRDATTALRSRPFTFENFNDAHRHIGQLIVEGDAMNRLFDQQLADIVKKPVPVALHDQVGMSVNCTPQFASEAGNTLAQAYGLFGMTWVVGEGGQVFVSLRSVGDYDVSALAKRFGGGGHRNAAGFKTTFDKLKFNDQGVLEVLP